MSVCLCMVVKNESALIREALRSARPFIDSWSIVDTGSTDNTLNIIHEELNHLPGNLYTSEWKNYGHNRTEAIQFAKLSGGCDWILLLDADETIEAAESTFPPLDPKTAYWMTVQYGSVTYARPNLINVKQNWTYEGVTHEYLKADPMPPTILLPFILRTNPTRCTKSVDRCLEDVKVLTQALSEDPRNGRYVFYLGQSYRDAGNIEKAIHYYKLRASMEGWFEETWYAQYQVALLQESQMYPKGEIIEGYLKAYNMNPARSEPLGALARYLRLLLDYHSAYLFAAVAAAIPRPKQILFVDDSYYNWRNKDEKSIAAYWTGRYNESMMLCEELLRSQLLPSGERARVLTNKKHCLDRMAEQTKSCLDQMVKQTKI